MTSKDIAIVYCEANFNTPNGKTAHGLVRFSNRYRVVAVLDSKYAGQDAGVVLDGEINHIPIFETLSDALEFLRQNKGIPTHYVIGLAPDGGKLSAGARKSVLEAIEFGLNIDCGLHDFLSDDAEIMNLAMTLGVKVRDIRKPPNRKDLHFFCGKIEQVQSFKIAMLGTDSAVGKRTTAWSLIHALKNTGFTAEMIGTGQTAWLQGAQYSIVLDSLVNDFVTGEIEHVIWKAWDEKKPEYIVIEGQGSLLNPAYPGGYEILAAGRPDAIILQHAPARKYYDCFPGYTIHPLAKQIQAIELISGRPVIAITINHEDLDDKEINRYIRDINKIHGLPVFDVLKNGADELAQIVTDHRQSL